MINWCTKIKQTLMPDFYLDSLSVIDVIELKDNEESIDKVVGNISCIFLRIILRRFKFPLLSGNA